MLPESEFLIRILVAAIVGLAIGFTRRRKAAGVRTFGIICLGCAIFTMISLRDDFQTGTADPSRIVSQIVTGIGFLGLGVIWHNSKNEGKPMGLTTAATVWTTAAIGVLVGLGSWTEAFSAALVTMGIVYYKEDEHKQRAKKDKSKQQDMLEEM
ncbi:MgtC/SapB family protein [Candidatus Micrarchaeota archaeon]|nr:MgtC/SapB family protein [Candidatus Micrarchaeota archaeon]MBU1166750.1 MgtC/SapB family protein [Candidatus Micrarchaeota archaeon]MBU1886156.1 MgtC/SapB family protein [Candidatus Micrarchaeota archaeon]